MRGGFSKAARACFPNARICIDPFHVVKLLNEAVDAVRCNAWRTLMEEARQLESHAAKAKDDGDIETASQKALEAKKVRDDAKLVKSSKKILLTDPYNYDAYWNRNEEKRNQRLKDLYAIAPQLEDARQALVEYHDVTVAATYKCFKQGHTKWIDKYSECGLPPIRQAAFSIRKHHTGIENSWRYDKSNGATEGLNKKIKDIRRMAFGAHNFENFRRRALLACGPTTIDTVRYTIPDEKATEPGREGFPLYE